jgi:hypothetical protein
MKTIIESAYLRGFEPSSDTLSFTELYDEAVRFLTDLTI